MDPITISALSHGAQKLTDFSNMAFSLMQQRRQEKNALEFWRLNNQYNHPSAQMARLRDAGLNPHLVYGSGADARSAGQPALPGQAQWHGSPIPQDMLNPVRMMSEYQDIEVKQAQADNLREQNSNLIKEQALKDLELLQKGIDLDITKETKDAIVRQAFENLNQTMAQTQAIGVDMWAKAQHVSNEQIRTWNDVIRTNTTVMNAQVERAFMRAGISQRQAQTLGQQFLNRQEKVKAELWEKGINPNDPTWLRVLTVNAEDFWQEVGKPIYDKHGAKGFMPGYHIFNKMPRMPEGWFMDLMKTKHHGSTFQK